MNKTQKPDCCLRCNRKLKKPSPTGMGPVCTKKAQQAIGASK